VGNCVGGRHRRSVGLDGVRQFGALVDLPTDAPLHGCHAVGLGPFAGVLALWIHTTGVLAKLFSEAVEAIDPQPVEGIRSTGASALHEIVYGVIPQVMPLWISFTLYRLESNVRSASVVGMVGAGGIGVVLWEIIRGFQYAETCAVMIIIIVSVTAIDLLSARIRKILI
jgi:phosphonate transport system permease protein